MGKINSLCKFIERVDIITKKLGLASSTTTHPWFRGQSDSSWDLVPNIYRNGGSNDYEREMIRDFKLHSSQFLAKTPDDELGWLFVMQHYGMSTRLLDWTESCLIALYFAVLNYNKDTDATVWVLDSWSLNECVISQTTIPTTNHPLLNEYIIATDPVIIERQCRANFPVAIRPARTTPRIVAQKGMFTLHGTNTDGLKKICTELNSTGKGEVNLHEIKIEKQSKLNILKQLHQAGISHSVLFPELEGLSKEINFKYCNEYIGYKGHAHNGF